MKQLLNMLTLICCLSASAESVPQSWYTDASDKNISKSREKENDDEEAFGRYLTEVSDSYGTMLEAIPENNNKSDKHWVFDEYRALYSISLHGLFGITGLRSTSAIETRWLKKSEENHNKEDLKENEFEVMIAHESSQEDVLKSFDPFINEAMKRKLIRSEATARQELKSKIDNIQNLLNDIAENQSDEDKSDKNWEAKFLRLDFTVGVSGNIAVFAKVGGEFRFRTIWKIPHKAHKINKSSEEENEHKENLHELLTNLSDDIEEAYNQSREDYLDEREEETSINFDIESIGVGLTFEQNVKWAIAQSDFRADFFLIFGPKAGAPKSVNKLNRLDFERDNGEYMVVADSENNDQKSFADLFRNKRSMLRKTLRKAMGRAQFVSDKMGSKQKKKWVLEKIRVDYALQKTGFLGIAGSKSRVFTEVLVAIKRENQKINEKAYSFFSESEKSFLNKGAMEYLNEIQLRLRTSVAFKLPVVELRFFPELEFIIKR